MATIHIEANKEDIAPRVLMPGDPNRAYYIAHKTCPSYCLAPFLSFSGLSLV